MGHQDIKTTLRYSHVSPEGLLSKRNIVQFGANKEGAEVIDLKKASGD
jgi:hypothetical protein